MVDEQPSGPDSVSAQVRRAIDAAHRTEWARVLAAAARLTRDLDLAEECTQDAYATALRTWPTSGVPARPGAWLTTVAGNRAKDLLRRESAGRRALQLAMPDLTAASADEPGADETVDDERLRLIFTCCHPALALDAQVALTLRLVCGLSTVEVARAFLVTDSTMAARITRAKKKIAAARIPYRVPAPEQFGERLTAVLTVVDLIFTTGHTAPTGEQLLRRDLIDGAIDLARLLHLLMPSSAQVAGLLALLILNDARTPSRTTAGGRLLLLSEQDRSSWDQELINEGIALLTTALARQRPTRYAVQAAIAAVHAEAPSFEATDWTEIAALYDVLLTLWDSPVVALNRAIAIGFRDGPDAGLAALAPLAEVPALATYGYLSAARADFLRRLGRRSEAALAYQEALALTDNQVERDFLAGRVAEVEGEV